MSELAAKDDLIEVAVASGAAAVGQLLWAYYSQLLQRVEQMILDRARRHCTSEVILELVFAQAFRDIRRFQSRGDGSFVAWLRTIADHRPIDGARKLDLGGAQKLSWPSSATTPYSRSY
jgi:DNA-directed RNA polymerase specialized sigma24 family protein